MTNRNAKSHAILSAINYSTYPLDGWWFLTSVTGIGLFGLWAIPLTILMIGLGLIIGVVDFHESYKRINQAKEDTIKFFKLAILQLQVLDELYRRKGQKFLYDNENPVQGSGIKKDSPKELSFSSRKSILIGAGATFTMGVFFLGIGSLLADSWGIVFASALVGPVGWPIALAGLTIAIGLGIYLAYKHFQTQKANYFIETMQEQIMNQINVGREEYEKFKSIPEDKNQQHFSQETAGEKLSILSTFAIKAVQKHHKFNGENKQYVPGPAHENWKQMDQWWHCISKLSFFKPRSKATRDLDKVVKDYSQGKKSLDAMQAAIKTWQKQQVLSASERCEAVQRLEHHLVSLPKIV